VTSISATSRCSNRCPTAGPSGSFSHHAIQRLRRDHRNAVLADITCDSDGKIDRFVHPRITNAPWRCMRSSRASRITGRVPGGAYQETLGDLHNLFGDTHVSTSGSRRGGWWIEEIVKGDTASKVLDYMEYDTDQLYPASPDCERAVQEGA